MKSLSTILFTLISLLLWTCQNIEDATLASRDTFIKYYELPYDLEATDFEPVSDGFVILGNLSVPPDGTAVDSIVTVVFKTDNLGNRISDYNYYYGGSGKSIKQHPDGGYIIVGDSIKRDLNPEFVANGIISSARILVIDNSFVEQFRLTITDENGSIYKTDFSANAITINSNDEVIILGSYIAGVQTQLNEPERPLLFSLTKQTNNALTLNWLQRYDLVERSYKNTRTVHTTADNNIIWASSISRTLGEVTLSYVTIPYVQANSQFINSSSIGETQEQLLIVNDIQPAKFSGVGYGIVGSYSEPNATDGSKSNLFFMRVAPNGNLIEGSERYFDGILSEQNTPLDDNTQSSIIDQGLAIAATKDGGYVIAGTITTNPEKGNGGDDIILIKVNGIGDMVWNKVIGGAGDEVVSRIKESDDGGLLILGTNTLGGASTGFLIKTDNKGELKN